MVLTEKQKQDIQNQYPTYETTKCGKLREVPKELEGMVVDMYNIFEGDEYSFTKSYQEFTRKAIRDCWKKYDVGAYASSPFKKKNVSQNSVSVETPKRTMWSATGYMY